MKKENEPGETEDEMPEAEDEQCRRYGMPSIVGKQDFGCMDTADELGETEDDLPETADEAIGTADMVSMRNVPSAKRGKFDQKRGKNIGNKIYYGRIMKELLPYILAVLILLIMTQVTVWILRNQQEVRHAELYRTSLQG